jgi:hypothetical protein
MDKEEMLNLKKEILGILSEEDSLSPEDLQVVCNCMDNDDFEDEEFDNGLAELYAKHIRNYLYKYKPEAKNIDSSIDPNEQHVGPMAQDIEKVAPDCVKETENGTKVVDGDRLALVNAGVIADLVRRLDALEEKLGVKTNG